MHSKIFTFNKASKNNRKMEETLNKYFSEGNQYVLSSFIGGTKLIISLLCRPCNDLSKIVRCKIIRTSNIKHLERDINIFISSGAVLKGKNLALSGSSTVFAILFYLGEPESTKERIDGSQKAEEAGPGQAGTPGQDQTKQDGAEGIGSQETNDGGQTPKS